VDLGVFTVKTIPDAQSIGAWIKAIKRLPLLHTRKREGGGQDTEKMLFSPAFESNGCTACVDQGCVDFLPPSPAGRPPRAIVIGGGFIGLEMCENLHARNMHVTVVEKLPQVSLSLPQRIIKTQQTTKTKKTK
jgi:NADPH-dependent 2,4-dienoyl-CoA reductase/sulfur reductase-like enzyme